jgi:hypothetical protein
MSRVFLIGCSNDYGHKPFDQVKKGSVITSQISLSFQAAQQTFSYLPKSSTRRKSRFLFVIETARASTSVGETEGPAPAHVSHEDLMYYNS